MDTIATIESELAQYYKSMGCEYEGGRFREFLDENGFGDEDIEDLFDDEEPEYSVIVEFDEDFPLTLDEIRVLNDVQKAQRVIEIFRQFMKGSSSSERHRDLPKLTKHDFIVSKQEMDKYRHVLKRSAPLIYNNTVANETSFIHGLSIGYRLNFPYLEYLCDAYTRDDIREQMDRVPREWALTKAHFQDLKNLNTKANREIDIDVIVISAISGYFHRIMPQIRLKHGYGYVIDDTLREIANNISTICDFTKRVCGSNTTTLPFQIDICFLFKRIISKSTVHAVHDLGDEADDDDGDGENQDSKEELKQDNWEYIDIEGRLKANKLKYSVIKLQKDSHETICKTIADILSDEFKGKRVIALFDRRKEEMLYVYEPPSDCNKIPPDYIPETLINNSMATILPHKGYNNGDYKYKQSEVHGGKINNISCKTQHNKLLAFSFHAHQEDDVRCYMYLGGSAARFMPEDINGDLLRRLFVDNEENKAFVDSKEAEDLVANTKIVDSRFETFCKLLNKNNIHIYKFGRTLSSGAFSRVVEAQNKTNPKEMCAIKIMDKDSAVIETLYTREVFILEKLTPNIWEPHSGILPFMGHAEDDDSYYIVTRLMSGGTLFDRILSKGNKYKITQKIAAELVLNMLKAVKYCHANNVVHRNLKLENFVFANNRVDSDIVLIDFGFAKYVHDDDEVEDVVGTAYYLAPELAVAALDNYRKNGEAVSEEIPAPKARTGRILKATDVWGIGVIAYIMMTGRAPFRGRNNIEILESSVLKPLIFELELGYYFEDFINKTLIKDPLKRISIDDAILHPWVQMEFLVRPISIDEGLGSKFVKQWSSHNEVINYLRQFSCQSKLKKEIARVSAANMTDDKKVLRHCKRLSADNDGFLDLEELTLLLLDMGYDRLSAKDKADEMIKLTDTNKNGVHVVDFERLYYYNKEYFSPNALSTNSKYIHCVFDVFDYNGDGYIDSDELKLILFPASAQKYYINEEEKKEKEEEKEEEDPFLQTMKKMIKEVDTNGNGKIIFEQFEHMMKEDIDSGKLTFLSDENDKYGGLIAPKVQPEAAYEIGPFVFEKNIKHEIIADDDDDDDELKTEATPSSTYPPGMKTDDVQTEITDALVAENKKVFIKKYRRILALFIVLCSTANVVLNYFVFGEYFKYSRFGTNLLILIIIAALLIKNVLQIRETIQYDIVSDSLGYSKALIFVYYLLSMLGFEAIIFLIIIWLKMKEDTYYHAFVCINYYEGIWAAISGTIQIYLMMTTNKYYPLQICSFMMSILVYSISMYINYRPVFNELKFQLKDKTNLDKPESKDQNIIYLLFVMIIISDYILRSVTISVLFAYDLNIFGTIALLVMTQIGCYVLLSFIKLFFENKMENMLIGMVTYELPDKLCCFRTHRIVCILSVFIEGIKLIAQSWNCAYVFIMKCDPKYITRRCIENNTESQQKANQMHYAIIQDEKWRESREKCIMNVVKLYTAEIIMRLIFNTIYMCLFFIHFAHNASKRNHIIWISLITIYSVFFVVFVSCFSIWFIKYMLQYTKLYSNTVIPKYISTITLYSPCVILVGVEEYQNADKIINLVGIKKDMNTAYKLFSNSFNYKYVYQDVRDIHVRNDNIFTFDDTKYDPKYKISRDELLKYLTQKRDKIEKEIKQEIDGLIIVFSAHGNRDGICCSDWKTLSFNKIFDLFNATNCAGLRGKPKLFFIDCCRTGNNQSVDSEINNKIERDQRLMARIGSNNKQYINKRTNFFKYYATTKGDASYMESEAGSFFIRALKDSCRDYSRLNCCNRFEINLSDIQSKVNERVNNGSRGRQTAECSNTLLREVYLSKYKAINITPEIQKILFDSNDSLIKKGEEDDKPEVYFKNFAKCVFGETDTERIDECVKKLEIFNKESENKKTQEIFEDLKVKNGPGFSQEDWNKIKEFLNSLDD